MVLPERIELSTSPVPRECSTTELRQPEGRDYTYPGRLGKQAQKKGRCEQRPKAWGGTTHADQGVARGGLD